MKTVLQERFEWKLSKGYWTKVEKKNKNELKEAIFIKDKT